MLEVRRPFVSSTILTSGLKWNSGLCWPGWCGDERGWLERWVSNPGTGRFSFLWESSVQCDVSETGGCERMSSLSPLWLVLEDPLGFFSPSSPARGLDYPGCPAVLPATTTRRTSSTEATVSPALRPETLDPRWTVSPSPAAVAALLRRMSRRSLLPLLELKMEERRMKKRSRERCWRTLLRERCRPLLRMRPSRLLHHNRGPRPAQTLWFPPSACRCCLRNTLATLFISSDSRRRKQRNMVKKEEEPAICLHRWGGRIHRHSSTSCHTTTNNSNNNIYKHIRCFPSACPSFQFRVKGYPRPSTPLLCCTGQRDTVGLRLQVQLKHIWTHRFRISAGAVPTGVCLPLITRTNTATGSQSLSALRWWT